MGQTGLKLRRERSGRCSRPPDPRGPLRPRGWSLREHVEQDGEPGSQSTADLRWRRESGVRHGRIKLLDHHGPTMKRSAIGGREVERHQPERQEQQPPSADPDMEKAHDYLAAAYRRATSGQLTTFQKAAM